MGGISYAPGRSPSCALCHRDSGYWSHARLQLAAFFVSPEARIVSPPNCRGYHLATNDAAALVDKLWLLFEGSETFVDVTMTLMYAIKSACVHARPEEMSWREELQAMLRLGADRVSVLAHLHRVSADVCKR